MIKVNFGGKDIKKPGFYGYPWWDVVWKRLSRKRNYSDNQVTSFLKLTDTLIRLELHEERLWRERNVK